MRLRTTSLAQGCKIGALRSASCWVGCRPGFFLPVRVLSRLYRRLFLTSLQEAFDDGRLRFFTDLATLADPTAFAACLKPLRRAAWVVYAKRPFGGPGQVLEYLGRYTHRVAIANSRIIELADGRVSFLWRDYRHHDKCHYGYLANGHRAARLALCRRLLAAPISPPVALAADYRQRYQQLTGRSLDRCPCCGGRMVEIGLVPRTTTMRAAPIWNSS